MSGEIDVVAVDGPAGSGKSTVAKDVAKRLNFLYVDTGAMYRALTLKALREEKNLSDTKALVRLSEDIDIRLAELDGSLKVILDGSDVTEEIRSLSVSQNVKSLTI